MSRFIAQNEVFDRLKPNGDCEMAGREFQFQNNRSESEVKTVLLKDNSWNHGQNVNPQRKFSNTETIPSPKPFKVCRFCALCLVVGPVILSAILIVIRFNGLGKNPSLDNSYYAENQIREGTKSSLVETEKKIDSSILNFNEYTKTAISPAKTRLICSTQECADTANDIRKTMNVYVQPCDNFYEFACGRYVPKMEGRANPHEEVLQKYNLIIEAKLNQSSSDEDHIAVKYARKVYHNCLKATVSDESANARTFLHQTMGIPWPIRSTPANMEPTFISHKVADLLVSFFLKALFNVELALPSISKGTRTTLEENLAEEKLVFQISAPTFDIPLQLRSKVLSTFEEFVRYAVFVDEVMSELGVSTGTLSLKEKQNMSIKIVKFEQALYKATDVKEKENSEEFSVLELEKLQRQILDSTQTPKVSIRGVVDHILEKSNCSKLNDNDTIFIYNSKAVRAMSELISRTSSEVLLNYLGYRLALALVPYSPKLLPMKNRQSQNPFLNTKVSSLSRGQCLEFVSEAFSPALTRYSKTFNENDTSLIGAKILTNIQEIFNDVRDELILKIQRNAWLEGSREEEAIKGLKSIRSCQDNWVFNEAGLDNYYEGIYTSNTSFIEQYSTITTWKLLKQYKLHGGAFTDMCDSGLKMAAFYVPRLTQMNIPPPFWLQPFYDEKWPAYLKYSGLADTMSHEIMHATLAIIPEWIENPNANSDLKSIFQNPKKMKELLKRFPRSVSSGSKFSSGKIIRSSQCIIKHYNEYYLKSSKYSSTLAKLLSDNPTSLPKINGTRTFEENVCDIGGIQLAFSAYKSVLERNKNNGSSTTVEEEGLPGLTHYTNDQLFFLNYARKWCDGESPLIRSFLLDSDEHSPPEYRVFGVLRNNRDFARVWNCPVGSFMNPKVKCPVF